METEKNALFPVLFPAESYINKRVKGYWKQWKQKILYK